MSYRYLAVFLISCILVGCTNNLPNCSSSMTDSLLEVKTLLSSSLEIGILSIYPTIWAIMVARKILL
jgi:hypothetical protein